MLSHEFYNTAEHGQLLYLQLLDLRSTDSLPVHYRRLPCLYTLRRRGASQGMAARFLDKLERKVQPVHISSSTSSENGISQTVHITLRRGLSCTFFRNICSLLCTKWLYLSNSFTSCHSEAQSHEVKTEITQHL